MIEFRKGAEYLVMFMFLFMSACPSDAGSGMASKNVPVTGMFTSVDLG